MMHQMDPTKIKILIGLSVMLLGLLSGFGYHFYQEREKRIQTILNSEVISALEKAWEHTAEYKVSALQSWDQKLQQQLDTSFLPWYYSFSSRMFLEGKATVCLVASLIKPCQPEKMLEKDVLDAFQNKVIAQAGTSASLSEKVVHQYTSVFADEIQKIPQRHPEINAKRLDVFLEQTMVNIASAEGDLIVTGSLATLVKQRFNNETVTKKMVQDMLKDSLKNVSSKLAVKTFGKSAKHFSNLVLSIGLLAWDYYELKQEERNERGPLREQIRSAFLEMENEVSQDLDQMILAVESAVLNALPANASRQVAHRGPVFSAAAYAASPVSLPTPAATPSPQPTAMPTPAPTTTPAPKAPADYPYALQVASRKNLSDARALSQALPQGQVIERKNKNGEVLFAVLSGGFDTQENALKHKEYLKNNYSHVGTSEDIPKAFIRNHPDLDVKPAPRFTLQIASRRTVSEAQSLCRQLPDCDFAARDVNGTTWQAVLVGDFATKAEAEAHKQKLLRQYAHVGNQDDLPKAFARQK